MQLIWREIEIPTGPCTRLPFGSFQLTYKLEEELYLSVVKLPFMPKKFKAYGKTEAEAKENAALRALVYVD